MKFIAEERLSQYPAIYFEFEGITYQIKSLSVSLLENLAKIQSNKKVAKRGDKILIDQMRSIFPDMAIDVIKRIDIRVIQDFILYLEKWISDPENYLSPDLKKKIESGEIKPKESA